MKKLFALLAACFVLTSVVFTSCEKSTNEPQVNSSNCADSAYLLADSIACSGKKLFYLVGKNKTIAVATGLYPSIDSNRNGGLYLITYDSLQTTTACYGAIYKNALLTCYQRK